MSEWFKEHAWKACRVARLSQVRILFSPPVMKNGREAKALKVSATPPKSIFYCDQPVKLRYIDPLWNGERMSKACKIAKKAIDKSLAYDQSGYVYLEK